MNIDCFSDLNCIEVITEVLEVEKLHQMSVGIKL